MRTKATQRPPLKLPEREVIVFDKLGTVISLVVTTRWGKELVTGGHYAPDWWASPRQRWRVDDSEMNKADTLDQHLKKLAKNGYVYLLPDHLLAKGIWITGKELKEWMTAKGIRTERLLWGFVTITTP